MNYLLWIAQSRTFLPSLVLALIATGCNNDEPPTLIRQYEALWEVSVGSAEIYPVASHRTDGIRVLPDSNLLVFGTGLSAGNNFSRFIKLDADGKVVTRTAFNSYSGLPLISSDGTITSLSDSLRRFDINLGLISSQRRIIDKFGLLAFTDQFMIYTDFDAIPVALVAYGHDGASLWKKPARALGCGGNYMGIEVLGNLAGMFTRSTGPQLDTLRLSAFEVASGKPVWIHEFLSNKVFGGRQLAPQIIWNADGSSALIIGGDSMNSRIYGATISSRDVRNNFIADLSSHPFQSVVRCVRTRDNGYLFGLNGNIQSDYYTYRLAKADRYGKVGWVGTFTFTGNDYLVDLLELADGTIVAATGQGNVSAYRPVY